jgi:hypothetical protein
MFENCAHCGEVKQHIRSATDEEDPDDEFRASDVLKDECQITQQEGYYRCVSPNVSNKLAQVIGPRDRHSSVQRARQGAAPATSLVGSTRGDSLERMLATAAPYIALMDADMLNKTFAYCDRRLRGRRLLWGLATFYAACVVGAVLNLGIAGGIRDSGFSSAAGAAGVIAGAVWNCGATSLIARRSSRYHPPKGAAA